MSFSLKKTRETLQNRQGKKSYGKDMEIISRKGVGSKYHKKAISVEVPAGTAIYSLSPHYPET